MGLASDVFADLIKMQLHSFSVGLRQDESRACPSFGADGPEQIGVVIALIGWQAWPGSLLCPDAYLTVLLSNARFILEPDFDRRIRGQIGYVR